MKVVFDGDDTPTICGTGTEDYLDSAWGLGPFAAPESGAPLVVASGQGHPRACHRLVSFYRWHLSDPVVFVHDLRVTVQQLGMDLEGPGLERVLAMPPQPVDVMMAPHHGSKVANTPALAAWAKPRLVIA